VVSGSRVEDIRVAAAQVQGAQGKVDQIRSMIDKLAIKAPVSARVEALDLRPGDLLAPSSTAATLIEDDQLYVRIYVPETELGHVAVGQRVAIHVDSFPDQAFGGVVQRIHSVGEYSPRTLQTADERADQVFATRIGIASGGDRLRAGMAATITVPRD
jgi:multidrug resistance efflux pump